MPSLPRRLYPWTLVALQLVAVAYLWFTGRSQDTLTAALPIAIFLAGVLLAFSIMDRSIELRTIHISDYVRWTAKSAVVALLLAVILVAFYFAGADLILWSFADERTTYRVVIGTAFVGLIGFIAFSARKRMRSTYGVIEVLAGMIIAFNRIGVIGSIGDLSKIDTIIGLTTAAVFLVVRGFDNIAEGLKPGDATDMLVAYFRRYKNSQMYNPWPDEFFN